MSKKQYPAALALLDRFSALLGKLLNVAALAWVVGWLAARSYFRTLGAGWLIYEAPTHMIFWAGAQTILVIVFSMMLAGYLGATRSGKFLGAPFSPAWWLVVLGFAAIEARDAGWSWETFWLILLLFATATSLRLLLRCASGGEPAWRKGVAWLVLTLTAFGLLIYNDHRACSEAKAAMDPQNTALPLVSLDGQGQGPDHLRLLFVAGEKFYLARLRSGDTPEIVVVGPSKIAFVKGTAP